MSKTSQSLSTAQQSIQPADDATTSSQSGQQQVSAQSQSTVDQQAQVPPVNTGTSIMKTQFLPNAGDPPLKWTVWYQMFEDHLVATGMDSVNEARKLAILRSSLGTEGYRICTELCAPRTSYADTVEQLNNRFAPKQSTIYARAQFNRRIQSSHETCVEYVTALRALARKCNYLDEIFDELVRDRFVAGCANDRLREKLLLEPDELTLDQALTIAQTFERATTESSTVSRCNPNDSVHALGAKKSCKARGRSPSRGSQMRNNSPQLGRSPQRKSSPHMSG